jgi:hypothetical protein
MVIKQCGRPGSDTKLFRAYATDPGDRLGRMDQPLGVSCSTTSNPEHGAARCDVKALNKMMFGDPNRTDTGLETRVRVREVTAGCGVWLVVLAEPKEVRVGS